MSDVRKETRTILRTDKQVFDVLIVDYSEHFPSRQKKTKYFKNITVYVGEDRSDVSEVSNYHGYQSFSLKIESDTNISLILRDWKDLMDLLPNALMEHSL